MGPLKAKDSSTLFIYKASKYDNNENHPDCMSLDKCSLMNHIRKVHSRSVNFCHQFSLPRSQPGPVHYEKLICKSRAQNHWFVT